MEVKTISYKRVHNLGNYSSEHIELTAELTKDDNVQAAIKELKLEAETALGIVKPEPITPKKLDEKPW